MSNTIILNESQMRYIISRQMLNEDFKNNMKAVLSSLLIMGLISTKQANRYMESGQLPKELISYLSNENKEETPEWELIADDGVITVYNAVAGQCNADYGTTASGFKLNLNDVGSHHVCAMERTFMKEFGIQYGDVIKIEGTYKGLQDGVYQVQDTMNKRFAGKHKIDILVPNNVRTGGTLKNQPARVYKLSNPENTINYTSEMAPSMKKKKK